jgi:hypothetical protein
VIEHQLFAPEIGRHNHGDTSALFHALRRRIDAQACNCGARFMNRKVNVLDSLLSRRHQGQTEHQTGLLLDRV